MAEASFVHRINLRPVDSDLSLVEENVNNNKGRRTMMVEKSSSTTSAATSTNHIPNEWNSLDAHSPPQDEPSATNTVTGGRNNEPTEERVDACRCCPYGYHIDLDFVQYAAEESKSGPVTQSQQQQNDSLNLFRSRKSKTQKDGDGRSSRSSNTTENVYENVPAEALQQAEKAGSNNAGNGRTKLENQSLFSNSLENVMSDFEETLSRGGSVRANEDNRIDYEILKGSSSLGKKQGGRTPDLSSVDTAHGFARAMNATGVAVGRADGGGYTSDCGYAVPAAIPGNRPSTLRFVAKPNAYKDSTNHYYASPNAVNAASSRTPTTMEYAIADATVGGGSLHQTAAISGSASSLSSGSSSKNINGNTGAAISVNTETVNSNGSRDEYKHAKSSRSPYAHDSYNQSSSFSSDLLSPRLLASSSPLPPKPSLGLSGRIGAQIERLASHLDAVGGSAAPIDQQQERSRSVAGHHAYDDDGRRESSPTGRILEMESSLRSAAPGPAYKGDNKRLHDELNRLIHDGKRLGYRRAITPTLSDTSGGGEGYATALARVMSTMAATASDRQRQQYPEPPPRRESVSRMQTGSEMCPQQSSSSTPNSPALPFRSRFRTYSTTVPTPTTGNGGLLNLDAYRSYRRIKPASVSSTSSNNTASTVVRPLGRSSSAGRRDDAYCPSDSEYGLGDRSLDRFSALRRSRNLLSRPQSTLPPPPPAAIRPNYQEKTSSAPYTTNTRPNNRRMPVNSSQQVVSIEARTTTTDMMGEVKVNGVQKVDASTLVNHIQEKPLMRTIGVLTDFVKTAKVANASTCTPPLPQPKPCTECDSLRQRLLALNVKPLTFTRGTIVDNCTCHTCERQSRQTFRSFGCSTSIEDTLEYRREAACTADIQLPCEECESRKAILKVSFGVNTLSAAAVEKSVNTDCVEVRNRHANTESKEFQSCSTNTATVTKRDAASLVEKQILMSCGAYRTITSNTTPPLMVTFGVNTDDVLLFAAGAEQEEAVRTAVATSQPETLAPIIGNGHAQEKELRKPAGTTREEGTMTEGDNRNVVTSSVETKSVSTSASLIPQIPHKGVRMIDKYVDSTVRTRDVGTRTPPPPPPPLQPLRSSGSQTIDPIRTMVSVGSGESTVRLSECDSCGGRETDKSHIAQFAAAAQQSNAKPPPPPPPQRTIQHGAIASLERRTSSTDSVRQQPVAAVPETTSPKSPDSQQSATVLVEGSKVMERRGQRGIQRVFSPHADTSREITTTVAVADATTIMWTSQTSAASDASSSRGGIEQTEESTVVCPLLDDDDEKMDAEERQSGDDNDHDNDDDDGDPPTNKDGEQKFDFTKPRPTRAFALSKAAAAKKLLTSDNGQQGQQQRRGETGKSSQQATGNNTFTFQRNYAQSRSVRLDTKKGDSLAYITEKKQLQQKQQGKPPAVPIVRPKIADVHTASSAGLKGKVAIKKNSPSRKVTPVPACPRQTKAQGNRIRPAVVAAATYHSRRSCSLPNSTAAADASSLLSSSSPLKDDDAAAEADDIVGPLPSEMVAIRRARLSSSDAACYSNPAVDDEPGNGDGSGQKKLVGDVVLDNPHQSAGRGNGNKNIDDDYSSSDDGSSSEGGDDYDDDTEESLEEGSYDTNGNISSTCDVTANSAASSKPGADLVENATNQALEMSPQLREACDVLNAFLLGKKDAPEEKMQWAQKLVQHEWLKTSASKRANPTHVGDFLDILEDYSPQLLQHVVNFCDQNENTALHYAVSRGHFDIVSLLLDTKVCNLNKPNKAGYTPVMLASLCPISSDTDSMVTQRLFQMGDVNIKASQHGQTALMLAVSHGNLETTKLLLEAGAGVNIQDEEGSTALMCAAEHGHKEIVRLLLAHSEIDASLADNDKSTALSIAVENDHKDIGILIYAHLNYGRSPPSLQSKSAPVWC